MIWLNYTLIQLTLWSDTVLSAYLSTILHFYDTDLTFSILNFTVHRIFTASNFDNDIFILAHV